MVQVSKKNQIQNKCEIKKDFKNLMTKMQK